MHVVYRILYKEMSSDGVTSKHPAVVGCFFPMRW